MFQVRSPLNGAEWILVPSAHPLEDCGVKWKETDSGCVCVSLQWSSPFFAKSLLHFWDTLQGNRAILGYLRCLKSRGMIKVVVVGGGEVVPAPGNLAWLWEEGRQTRNDFQLLVLYLSSSPTSPTTKVFLFPTPKAQLGFQETEKQHFVPDSAWSGQRSDAHFSAKQESYCQFPRSASLLMSGKKIQIHNSLPTDLKSKQGWTLKVSSSLICIKTWARSL